MNDEDLRSLLAARLRSHPPGLVPGGARMGAALHSETLEVLDLVASHPDRPWSARVAHDDDPTGSPFGHNGHEAWVPSRFERTSKMDLRTTLTIETLPGTLMRHRNGDLYTGVAPAVLEGTLVSIYANLCGVWWARPWAMFADGRFSTEAGRVCWRGPLERFDA